MKRVLFISYYFPPIGGIGSERPLAFARLLPEFGWEPVVLTPMDRTIRVLTAGEGMEIPGGLEVRRVANPDLAFRLKRLAGYDMARNVEEELFGGMIRDMEPRGMKMRLVRSVKNWAFFPDRMIDWYPFVVHEGMRLLRERQFDAIYTVSPPYTAALAGARLAGRTGVPWVCDMADLWTNCFNYMRTERAVAIDAWLERRTLRHASRIVVLADQATEAFDHEGATLSGRVRSVPHGYDERLFGSIEPLSEDGFTLLYAGQFSYPFQDPVPVMRAIARLRDRGEELSSFRLVYLGQSHDVFLRLAEEVGVTELVEISPQVPYREALARQKGASALLYIQWEPGGEIATYSKFAQYVGAGRPILAMAPTPGAADSAIAAIGEGRVARDEDDAASIISEWLTAYRASGSLGRGIDRATALSFSYSERARQLASVLDEAACG